MAHYWSFGSPEYFNKTIWQGQTLATVNLIFSIGETRIIIYQSINLINDYSPLIRDLFLL